MSLEFHQVKTDLPVALLDVQAAFSTLTDKEKLYAHHLSQASWQGALICLEQLSTESPAIFAVLLRLFSAQSLPSLQQQALANGVTQTEFDQFLAYVTAIFGNMGNYLSFGDTKLVPQLSSQAFTTIIHATALQGKLRQQLIDLYDSVKEKIYSLQPFECELGFPDRPATSAYYSADITKEQIELVTAYMNEKGISPYNTRLFTAGQKDGVPVLELRLAAAVPKTLKSSELYKGAYIHIVAGDYNQRLADVVQHLEDALPYCANENQVKMIESYIKSFRDGSIDDHKEASRHWVCDKNPAVESYIGFIESYRDPSGVRGEWEGFVSIVNKETSRKFAYLVDTAPNFLSMLPWPKEFEKDKFLRPDFTSLEVITFASSGVPAGINIPNYDDIRQDFGFKNVSLGNVLTAKGGADEKLSFLRDEDQHLFAELKTEAFEVQVAGHELLGHGSGKVFVRNADGTFNFDPATVNPLTGQPVASWYQAGETYDSVFGTISSSFEECRAECVGVYLSTKPEMLDIFGFNGQKASDIMFINWLNMVRAGVVGLEFYSPENKVWRQAHMQGRFAIFLTLLRASRAHHAANPESVPFINLRYNADQTDCAIELNRDLIISVGVPAVAELLRKIQILRSTADYATAYQFYIDDVTKVEGEFLELRKLVIAKKKPRRVLVQANTFLENGQVVLKQYEASSEGMIQSFVDRFSPYFDSALPAPSFA